ncbi:hypothetical protein [Staphylococcus saprophyticus]|nr:hypothetical protein [Staphylococcus saprophyticus]
MEEVGGGDCGVGIVGKGKGGVEEVECNEIVVGEVMEEEGEE